jgi:predicted nucleotidyltransferase
VKAAFVFGSVAQGKERGTSDVDVMVVGKAKFEKVVGALAAAQERLRRDVNPVVMAPAEFRAKLRARDRFLTRILSEPKIMLKGELRELGESRQDGAA